MLERYDGGKAVDGGVYLNVANGEFVRVPDEGGELPAVQGAQYYRVNPLAALLVGPFAGLAFVIVLPALAPIYLGYLMARRLWALVHGGKPAMAGDRVRS